MGHPPWRRRLMMSASVVPRDIGIQPVTSIGGNYVHAPPVAASANHPRRIEDRPGATNGVTTLAALARDPSQGSRPVTSLSAPFPAPRPARTG